MENGREIVLVADAAMLLRITRERVIRKIQLGAIAGGKTQAGQWYVERASLEQRGLEQPTAEKLVASGPRSAA